MPDLKIGKATEIEAAEVKMEGVENVSIRWLISKTDGAPNFAMRLFEVGPGGHTPFHSHEWEHEVYIVDGEGVLTFEGDEKPFSSGDFIFVPGGKMHRFSNTGDAPARFLCLVPNSSYDR